jgi:hypothetical protein
LRRRQKNNISPQALSLGLRIMIESSTCTENE